MGTLERFCLYADGWFAIKIVWLSQHFPSPLRTVGCCDVCSTICLCAWLGPAKGEALLPIPSFRVRTSYHFPASHLVPAYQNQGSAVQDVLQIQPAAMSWSTSTPCVVFIWQKIHEAFLMGPSPSMQILMVFERWQHTSTSCLVQRLCQILRYLHMLLFVCSSYCSLELPRLDPKRGGKGGLARAEPFYFHGDPWLRCQENMVAKLHWS